MLPVAMLAGNPVEWAIIAGAAVVLFGGAKIGVFMKSLGDGVKEFKKATTEEPHPPVVGQPGASVYPAPPESQVPTGFGAKTEEK